MRKIYYYLLAVTAAFALTACGERSAGVAAGVPAAATYPATLEEGIAFAKPGYPEFVAKTEGISIAEPFGRWTDGSRAMIEFKERLPQQFDLALDGAAFGPNIGQAIKVTIGSTTQDVIFDGDLSKGPQTRRLSFKLDQPANVISFDIPQPTQPSNGDVRKLGMALVSLKILAPGK